MFFCVGILALRGDRVPRRFPVALSPSGVERRNYTQGSGRLELAESILDPSNPLTSRVMANRIWKHLVGKGIVRTPSDFGLMGETPTHPELLDHLAKSFMENGWSIKKLIRTIVLSKTYRQESRKLPTKDPDNLYLSSMNRKRLNFEAMRDGMLQASGELDLTMRGPSQNCTPSPIQNEEQSMVTWIGRIFPRHSTPLILPTPTSMPPSGLRLRFLSRLCSHSTTRL